MHTISHNWAEHVAFGATSRHLPRTVEEVQELVRAARKLRVVGSRHSFNHVADTSGALLSLRALERRIEVDPVARTVTVDGGITHAELAPVLDAAGWALTNLASVLDFTVVGAVSTAIHGSGSSNRNLASAVAALEIVTASGELLRLKRGDADFDGAVVGLGLLGVVTTVTLDIVPRFDMRQDVFLRLPFGAATANFDALMGSAYSVSLFTHWNGDVVDQAWLKGLAGSEPPAQLFGGTPAPGPVSPVTGRDPTGTTEQCGVIGPWFDRLPHGRIGTLPGIGTEFQSEYFVARSDALAAMQALKSVEQRLHSALIVSEIRTVAADDFWLSMNYGRDSVGFHFSMARDWTVVKEALHAIEGALASFDPRPHWGKLFVMPAETVRAQYPRLDDFRELAARHDPDGKFRNAFADELVFGD